MLPADNYVGQVVVVTGVGTELGKAMALEFARLGAAGVRTVTVHGAQATGVELDVRDPAAVALIFDEIETTLGRADVLINNATGRDGSAESFPASESTAEEDIGLE